MAIKKNIILVWTISRSPPQSSFSIHELTDNLETVLLEARVSMMNTDKVNNGKT